MERRHPELEVGPVWLSWLWKVEFPWRSLLRPVQFWPILFFPLWPVLVRPILLRPIGFSSQTQSWFGQAKFGQSLWWGARKGFHRVGPEGSGGTKPEKVGPRRPSKREGGEGRRLGARSRRGFTRQPESSNVHFSRPSKTPPKFHETTPGYF